MFVKSDPIAEQKIIEELIRSDEALARQHELFVQEMNFKQTLIDTRKAKSLTQKDISKKSGLSQQAVSRLEKGNGGTIETVLRYLYSMGMTLDIKNV
ncbi:MAG: helix-turn-helix domain-containing protein [Lachnospiraceae bacterium]|nr:helix-turn-helix domain-containing protein [Lachnospiraceae bacterium]